MKNINNAAKNWKNNMDTPSKYLTPYGHKIQLKTTLLLITLPYLMLLSTNGLTADRWYSEEQVTQGKALFAENCSACHGKNAESIPNWRQRDANGNYVPPPLNGTAHAWHHSMKILRHTVRKGGKPVGGIMPAFEEKLTPEQIDSIIAWFQSLWSDEIYSMWQQRNEESGFIPVEKVKTEENPVTSLLKQRLQNVDIGKPQPTPVNNVLQAKVGSEYAYLSSDGRYALIGELIDLKTGNNLTEASKSRDRVSLINAFPESEMTIFPSTNETSTAVTILTDTSCRFCKKLHKEIPKLQQAGITVRYIAFPRDGSQGEGYTDLKSIWCAKDRQEAMNIAKGITEGTLGPGDCEAAAAVDHGHQLGIQIGLQRTPTIVLRNGNLIQGYVPAEQLIQQVQANL